MYDTGPRKVLYSHWMSCKSFQFLSSTCLLPRPRRTRSVWSRPPCRSLLWRPRGFWCEIFASCLVWSQTGPEPPHYRALMKAEHQKVKTEQRWRWNFYRFKTDENKKVWWEGWNMSIHFVLFSNFFFHFFELTRLKFYFINVQCRNISQYQYFFILNWD